MADKIFKFGSTSNQRLFEMDMDYQGLDYVWGINDTCTVKDCPDWVIEAAYDLGGEEVNECDYTRDTQSNSRRNTGRVLLDGPHPVFNDGGSAEDRD